MGDVLICPKCRQRLWVGDIQIPLVTCSRCLARVVNPNAARDEDGRRISRHVIPVESETSSDVRDIHRWLVALSILLFVGGILVAFWHGINLTSALMMAAGLVMGAAVMPLYRRSREVGESPAPDFYREPRGKVTILDYANIRGNREGSIGGFLSGFTLAIVISFLTFMAAAVGRLSGQAVGIIALAGGIATIIILIVRNASKSQNRDFFNGLVAGSILGGMSCGPCAVIGVFS